LLGTVGIVGANVGSNIETYRATTGALTSQSIWGVEYEPTTPDTQTNFFFVSELYYTGGTSSWDVVMSVKPNTLPPGPTWNIGYTIHYSYQ
jgi:hypothetical protein